RRHAADARAGSGWLIDYRGTRRGVPGRRSYAARRPQTTGAASRRAPPLLRLPGFVRPGRLLPHRKGRQANRERRADAGFALQRDRPAEHARQAMRHGEAEAGPALFARQGFFHLDERLEDALLRLGLDPDPGVGNVYDRAFTIPPHTQRDTTLLRELRGVGQEIDQDLPRFGMIGTDRDGLVGQIDLEIETFLLGERAAHLLRFHGDVADRKSVV